MHDGLRTELAVRGAALAVLAALVTGCGGNDERASTKAPALAPPAAVDADPYAIACGHVRDQMTYSRVTRRAAVAIADRERFPKLSRLRATQSLFYAMTQLCQGKPDSHKPAEPAVAGVRDGTYRADLSAP